MTARNNPPCVLVVEDQGAAAEDIRQWLRRGGYEVPATVVSGESAIEIAEKLHPELILMNADIDGEIDGITAAQEIWRAHSIPIVFLTADANDDILERAKTASPFGFLVKPLDERSLCSAVGLALHRHHLERQIRTHEQWLATVLRNISDGLIATDASGRIREFNPAAERLTGWSEAEAIGRPLHKILEVVEDPDFDQATDLQTLDPAAPEETTQRLVLITRDRRRVAIELDRAQLPDPTSVLDSKRKGTLVVFRDVSRRRIVERRVEHLALHDPLTDLPNRRLGQDRLRVILARAERSQTKAAVLFVDLDNLKELNDHFGHQRGDEVLMEMANRLRSLIRRSDSIARFGGDEFLVLLGDIREQRDVEQWCDKLFARMRAPMRLGDSEIQIAASVGVSLYPQHGQDPDLLIGLADAAMYAAKQAGRGRYRFTSGQQALASSC